MLTVQANKPASLVQQKKQQWAREREEMSHLYLPWGSDGNRYSERLQVRNQFASTLELHKQHSFEYQDNGQRQRSPSLPPIRNLPEQSTPPKEDPRRTKEVLNRNLVSGAKRFAFYDEDGEGDTSGYGSETVNMSIRRSSGASHDINTNPVIAWHQEGDNRNNNKQLTSSEDTTMNEGMWSARSPRSLTEEGRARWGDRGVATGRLWEPTAPNARLPQMQNQKKGTPAWVERGLSMIDDTSEILVIDQRSSINSGLDCERSSLNGSDEGRTFLRGQNVPLEPEIKAQRENKRIKALELQSAILSQLEDREKRKQEEREQKFREEKIEELRIQREQEEDRLRIQEERRKMEERQMLEQRKLETLKKALEDAEKKAKQEKEKRFVKHKNNLNITNNNTFIEKPQSSRCETVLNSLVSHDTCNVKEKSNEALLDKACSPTKTNRTYELHSSQSQNIGNKDNNSQQTTEFNSPRSIGTGNLNFFIQTVPPLPLSENQFSLVPIGINGELLSNQQNGLQLAVLVPQNLSNSLYSVSLNSLNNTPDTTDTTGKILTPRKFRNSKYKDASTQTDSNIFKCSVDKANSTEMSERNLDQDYKNIDENAPQENHHSTLKKDRRLRSEERYKKDLESRPKWGVNRPAAQYKKQSEKDPFYTQKRKIRQKHRPQPRQYLSQSSDDSRSPSPPMASQIMDTKKRNSLSQSYWKNKRSNHDFKDNNDVSEDISLQSDYNQIAQMTNNEISEHKKIIVNSKLSSTKRSSLSQKFINDKYGNRKFWNDEISTERNNKSYSLDVDNRKNLIEQLNVAKRDFLERLEDQDNVIMKTK